MNAPLIPPLSPSPSSREALLALFDLPFLDLLLKAQEVHRAHHQPNLIQLSTLCSIKTGGCPEDCSYCPQSVHYDTGLQAEKLMPLDSVLAAAQAAKDQGAQRFCMGAAWRSPKDRDLDKLAAMIEGVKAMGLETCMTLGMLEPQQAQRLADAGLDYYNHNLDTAPEFYGEIIQTRTYDDRLRTLEAVRESGMKVCCGGIVGMGESRAQRAGLLAQLAQLDPPPESVPINQLVPVPGTPLALQDPIDPLEFVRTIAVARIALPTSVVRLSAGREAMSDELQALCFLAGASSIFYGDALLTTSNPRATADQALFKTLGLSASPA